MKTIEEMGEGFLYVRGDHRGPAAARNLGLKFSRGRIIAFTDDDCRAESDWLSNLLKPFSERGVGGVTGKVEPTQPIDPLSVVVQNLSGESYLTGNMAFRRQILDQLGGFSERGPFASCEDYDLAYRVLEQGWKICFASSAVVHHAGQNMSRSAFVSRLSRAKYVMELFRQHPRVAKQHSGRGAYGNLFYHMVLGPPYRLLLWRKWLVTHSPEIPEVCLRSVAEVYYGLFLIVTYAVLRSRPSP
jgi:GT2 family glycosyltransferase